MKNDKIAPPGTEYVNTTCPFCGSHLIESGRWLWQCATCGKGALTPNPEA